MKKLWLSIPLVLLIAGGAVWWASCEAEVSPGPIEAKPEVSLDQPFVHAESGEEAFDAGVGRVWGRVIDENAEPVSSARVRLYAKQPEIEELECGVCHLTVLDCEDPSTVRQVIKGLHEGSLKPPVPVAEAVTGPDGTFAFENVPFGGLVVATSGKLSATEIPDSEDLTLVLEPALTQTLRAVDLEGIGIGSARVTLYSPLDGTLEDHRVDAEGNVTLASLDHRAWFFLEADGMLPVGRRLEMAGELVMTAPRTLIIHTRMGGQNVDADVEIFMHGEPRKLRTRDGVLKLEQLPYGSYLVAVKSDSLAAAEQDVELTLLVTELEFELRKGSKLLLTVVNASGEPLEDVSGSISGNDGNANADAQQGALLILGPVPEGEYTLSVTSEGMVSIDRPIDLKPGETNLEVTMRPAPRLTGLVLDGEGKPVARARVEALENEQEIALDLTDDEGKFDLELHYNGSFTLRAEEQRLGIAEGTAQLPGPPVTLRLNAKGVLEVEVFDADGQRLPADVMVRSEKGATVKWVEDDEGKPSRLAGLEPGAYVVEKIIPERMPITQKVEVLEGRVTRVVLRAELGATVNGKVIDHLGKPVEQAIVTVNGRPQTAVTGADGHFEWKGLTPGSTEVWAIQTNGAESKHITVTAPASEVVLTIAEVAKVTGRVVDERGTPITEFDANSERVKTPDGRFSVPSPNKTLDVWVEGFAAVYLTTAEGDVGDVVMKKDPVVEGDVLDGEGKPVSGATVLGSMDLAPATSDAAGRFKLTLTSDEPQDLIATRGAMSGRTTVKLGSIAHIVMQRGTSLSGKVVDPSGKPVPTQVNASSRMTQRPIEIDTDENGRFQLDLPQGVWIFSTRSNRVMRAVDVKGDHMELTLGEEAGACGLSLRSDKPIDAVWLLTTALSPDDGPWDLAGKSAGSVEVPVITPSLEVNARGLPCGSYTLAASIENVVTSIPLQLSQPAQRVFVAPQAAPLPEPAP